MRVMQLFSKLPFNAAPVSTLEDILAKLVTGHHGSVTVSSTRMCAYCRHFSSIIDLKVVFSLYTIGTLQQENSSIIKSTSFLMYTVKVLLSVNQCCV